MQGRDEGSAGVRLVKGSPEVQGALARHTEHFCDIQQQSVSTTNVRVSRSAGVEEGKAVLDDVS